MNHTPDPSFASAGIAERPVPCPKEAAVSNWVLRRLGTIEHERAVAEIATTLFDLTERLQPRVLSQADKKLLRFAAMVHDVGRCVDAQRHPAEGAAMILAEDALPLSQPERRWLAYFTLYHRGPVPQPGTEAILDGSDDPTRLLPLLALLRAADALNSRSLPTPQIMFALASPPARRLKINCYLQDDSAKARKTYTRRKKFRLLEEQLSLRIEIDIVPAETLRMVA